MPRTISARQITGKRHYKRIGAFAREGRALDDFSGAWSLTGALRNFPPEKAIDPRRLYDHDLYSDRRSSLLFELLLPRRRPSIATTPLDGYLVF